MKYNTKPYFISEALRSFYEACKTLKCGVMPCSQEEILRLYKEALLTGRNHTWQIILFSIDRAGLQIDDVFLALIDDFVKSKSIKLAFKIKVIKVLIRFNKWDLIVEILKHEPNAKLRVFIFHEIQKALAAKNIRCAAFMPRQGDIANRIRGFIGVSPVEWRGILVPICQHQITVMMSSNRWSEIDYSKLPTSIIIKYYRALRFHDKERFLKYLDDTPARGTTINRILNALENGHRRVKPIPTLEEVFAQPWYYPIQTVKGKKVCDAPSAK